MAHRRLFRKQVGLADGGARYRLERDKATAAGAVFHDRSDIVTPELVGCDDRRGELVFEFVHAMRPLCRGSKVELFRKAGVALALIHMRLRFSAGQTEAQSGTAETVFVHGDYWHGNLATSNGGLVVLDWGVRPWTAAVYASASPAVDLASFLAPFAMPKWWDPRVRSAKLRTFLAAYFATLGPNSSIARAAESGLRGELAAQWRYQLAEVAKRDWVRRLLWSPKLALNQCRLSGGAEAARHLSEPW